MSEGKLKRELEDFRKDLDIASELLFFVFLMLISAKD